MTHEYRAFVYDEGCTRQNNDAIQLSLQCMLLKIILVEKRLSFHENYVRTKKKMSEYVPLSSLERAEPLQERLSLLIENEMQSNFASGFE